MPEPLAALGHMAAHPSEQQLPGPPSASASSQQAAADAAGTDPATLNAQVQDSGGEVSMSIQETNRYMATAACHWQYWCIMRAEMTLDCRTRRDQHFLLLCCVHHPCPTRILQSYSALHLLLSVSLFLPGLLPP